MAHDDQEGLSAAASPEMLEFVVSLLNRNPMNLPRRLSYVLVAAKILFCLLVEPATDAASPWYQERLNRVFDACPNMTSILVDKFFELLDYNRWKELCKAHGFKISDKLDPDSRSAIAYEGKFVDLLMDGTECVR